jgi:hypothetical protein
MRDLQLFAMPVVINLVGAYRNGGSSWSFRTMLPQRVVQWSASLDPVSGLPECSADQGTLSLGCPFAVWSANCRVQDRGWNTLISGRCVSESLEVVAAAAGDTA